MEYKSRLQYGRWRFMVQAAGLLLAFSPQMPALAEEAPWRYCAPSFLPFVGMSSADFFPTTVFGDVQFSADHIQAEGETYRFAGDVIGYRIGQEVMADNVIYDQTAETLQATGNVRYQDRGRLVISDSAEFRLDVDSGKLAPAKMWFSELHFRGEATQIELQSPTLTQLESARFTTCDTGSDDWLLKASSVTLDSETGEGVARHARISFMQVPIFYTPYISFPLDERRKTGILVPTIGKSTLGGTELSVPYYWNIAPDRDATLAPRIMSKRGVLWESQFRYLNQRNHGELELAYMSSDDVYGDSRSAMTYSHLGNPAPAWSTRVDYRYASDKDYLDDFSNDLNTTSTTHLEQVAEVNYLNTNWQSSLRLQNFQTLDESIPETSRPYKRLPQFTLATRDFQAEYGTTFGMSSEWVYFEREAGVVGSRLDLQPRLSWPVRSAPGFFIPTLQYRFTQYQLEQSDPDGDSSPSRNLPLFSVDSGLVFERDLEGDSRATLQTLEPRLYYLYVPYRDQSELIVDENGASRVFDSSLPAFGINQLFRVNRFNGADRVGDANQLSTALTTRFLDIQGRELLSASLGRIFYFQDRKVTLPGGSVETESVSNWLAEMRSEWLSGFSSQASLQWNNSEDVLDSGTLDIRYLRSQRRVLRLGYRYARDTQKQVDIAGIWPLADHWNLVGRWLHSVQDDVTLEALQGIEYESCCWTARVVNHRYRVDATDEDSRQVIWLQLELKGLTSVGRKVEELMVRDILSP